MKSDISENLRELHYRIAGAARLTGREASDVKFIGVSKTRSASEIVEAYRAGLRDFGENRVQETGEKIPEVMAMLDMDLSLSPIRWHLIGHLQSNKVSRAVDLFDVIHSIDSVELAERVGRAAQTVGKVIECYIQVNVSGETTKSGTTIDGVASVGKAILNQPSLRLAGLMTIGPLTDDSSLLKSCFDETRDLRDTLEQAHPGWGHLGLSMGMSGDFELAISCGSTAIRIGSALFGERSY